MKIARFYWVWAVLLVLSACSPTVNVLGQASSQGTGGPGATGGGTGGTTGSSGDGGQGASSTTSSNGAGGLGGAGAAPVCMPGDVEACYSGPPSSEGVASCKSGVHSCLSDGSGFGPCEGEILPSAEVCGSPEDESCDGASGCTGEGRWIQRLHFYGSDSSIDVRAVGADALGRVAVVGSFSGTMKPCGEELSASYYQVFVVKYDASGACLWSKVLPDGAFFHAGAFDEDGSIVLAGNLSGAADLGGGPLNGDEYLVRYSEDGTHVYSRTILDKAQGMALDRDHQLYLAFWPFFGGSMDGEAFDQDSLYVLKLDAGGSLIWTKAVGTMWDSVTSLAADADGSLLVTGELSEAVDFGGGALIEDEGCNDIFLAKLDKDGQHVFSKSFVRSKLGAQSCAVQPWSQVAAAPDGRILLIGGFEHSPLDLGDGPMAPPDAPLTRALFMGYFDPSGQLIESRSAQLAAFYGRNLAAFDGASNLVVSTRTDDKAPLDLGDAVLPVNKCVAFKLAPDGSYLWSALDDQFGQNAFELSVGPDGSVFLAGLFEGSISFSGGLSESANGTDGYVVKLGP